MIFMLLSVIYTMWVLMFYISGYFHPVFDISTLFIVPFFIFFVLFILLFLFTLFIFGIILFKQISAA